MYMRLSILAIILCSFIVAQNNTLNEVHTFQTFLKDAPITTKPYGEAGLNYSSYENWSQLGLGIQGGYPVNPQFEVGGYLGFLNFSPDEGDGESGITDVTVAGRYNLLPATPLISAGAYLTLPIGSEDIGQGNFDYGAFGALRHGLSNGMVVTATVGLDFLERWHGRDVASHISAGGIFPVNAQLNVIGELNFRTDYDYTVLSVGGDYLLDVGGRVRGALGIGLEDGAPDLMIVASYLHIF
jgi:hypothetical protein